MTHQDLIRDIDALLSGDLSGTEQVRDVLREARAEIEQLTKALGIYAAAGTLMRDILADGDDITEADVAKMEWLSQQFAAIGVHAPGDTP